MQDKVSPTILIIANLPFKIENYCWKMDDESILMRKLLSRNSGKWLHWS
jgi:hypothetical protein